MTNGIVTIVQARLGSSRLPAKALCAIRSRPMFLHVLERSVAIGYRVVVATTVEERDDPIVHLAAQSGAIVHRGSEQDVLGRLADAARSVAAETVVRITADCPLLADDVARQVIDLYRLSGGITTNDTTLSGWPDGLDVEVFAAGDLYEAARQATVASDREHVTPWIRRLRQHTILPCPEEWPHASVVSRKPKLSVDTADDLARVTQIMSYLTPGQFGWAATRSAIRQWGLAEAERYRQVEATL